MITNTWDIIQLDCRSTVGAYINYVVTAHWNLSASDGIYEGYAYGAVSFDIDKSKPNYTDFISLTKPEVIDWVHKSLGTDRIIDLEATVAAQIQAQITPTIIISKLPWL